MDGLAPSERGGMRKLTKWMTVGAVAAAAVPIGVVVTLRSGNRRGIDAIRHFNRSVLNPIMLRTAGQPGSAMAVIHHRGRVSGIQYATPVVGASVPGGFLIPLNYGEGVDWLQNLAAAGAGSLELKGEMHPVLRPRVVPVESAAEAPRTLRMACRVLGTSRLARLEIAPLT